MKLPDGRVANLVAAVALPGLAFTAIAFVWHVVPTSNSFRNELPDAGTKNATRETPTQ